MRMRPITASERRTIIVATSLGLLVLLPTRVLPAWRSYRNEQREVARELVSELARAEQSVAKLPWLRDSLVATRERYLALAPKLIMGRTPSGAAATLSAHISGAAEGARARMAALEIRADTTAIPGLIHVMVETSLTCDVEGLTAFLLALERSPMLLRVRRIAISALQPGAPSTQPETLQVDLLVEGLAVVRAQQGKS